MNKSQLIGFGAATLLYVNIQAQDFYNGFKGPKGFQSDNYLTKINQTTSAISITKAFTKNIDESLPNLVIATAISITEKGIEDQGVNLGYICEMNNGSIIGALGLFKESNGKYRVLNPQIYGTLIKDKWTIDCEANLPINLSNGQKSNSSSLTLGYGLDELIRVGTSATLSKDSGPEYGANIRIEGNKNHGWWTQIYATTKKIAMRLAINF